MTAQIIRMPVVRKRGRKVAKGPMASIAIIYESTHVIPSLGAPEGTVEHHQAKLDLLVMKARARHVEEKAQQEAWIERSANVERWPESRRYRSEELVRMLRKGGEDEEPEIEPDVAEARRKFLADVSARRDQILAEFDSQPNTRT